MLWFTRGTRTKPVLVVTSIAAVLLMARSPGQAPASIELYKEPRFKHMELPDCRSDTPTHILDPVACEVLNSGMGGWAIVNLMVDPAGKPFEVAVTRSTGYKALDELARKLIAASSFEPGSLNGKPIESSFIMKYVLWQGPMVSGGAKREFIASYDALRKAVEAGDRTAADAAMKKLVITSLYEDAYLGMATYYYAKKWGDEQQQLEGLNRAASTVGGGSRSLPDDLYKSALQVSIQLQLQLRLYAEARETYKTLQKVGIDAATATRFKAAFEQLEKIRTDDSAYAVSGVLTDGRWYLRLFKRHFQAELTEGSVAQVKLRCQKHYVSFDFDPNLQYDVASKDGECEMEMIGTPGTRLKLMQF